MLPSDTTESLNRCCKELDAGRRRRDILKLLLYAARRDHVSNWIVATSAALSASREKLNRLCARRSRLRRALPLQVPCQADETVGGRP